jgi:hypothetical protein
MSLRGYTFRQPDSWAVCQSTHPNPKRILNFAKGSPKVLHGISTIVAVHAGKTWSDEVANNVSRITEITSFPSYQVGHIVGLMRLSGTVYTLDNPPPLSHPGISWWTGPFGLEVVEAEHLLVPIERTGSQSFWPVSDEMELEIYKQLPHWRNK